MKRLNFCLAFLAICVAAAGDSHAAAIHVSYTVTGTPGDYDVDFSVSNDMTAWHQNVYLFGVSLSGFDVASSPSPFVSLGSTSVNFAIYGGSDTLYNTNWQADPARADLLPGNSLSGFIAHDTDLVAPTSVAWFAFSQDELGYDHEPYTGGGNFNGAFSLSNPGFEGIANPAVGAVAEPSSLVMASILLCLSGIGRVLRRLKQTVKNISLEPGRP
jgi:hypothetical protein